MIVAVGSQNPAKLEAVRRAFRRVWPNVSWEIDGLDVASGVPDQPLSDKEMIIGAKSRALAALSSHPKASFGVGLEGGLHKHGNRWFGRSWITIADSNGQIGFGATASCLIPPRMMELVNQGKNMSQVCEILFGDKEIGKKNGYYGLLTNDAITRSSGYADGVIMALAVFIKPEIYS